ncbi:hypothetical protein [Sinorhizobium meliloti]|uniref:hypothetical protein n=1 Tax=Rhizobium meliloti TaxID=382 RepID=UPI000FD90BB8|nr:hypothetical protein [Sinorhizobium meliloti]RVL38023.1 hypothetical protein CN148_11955 [Sinorhizobium meliloti]
MAGLIPEHECTVEFVDAEVRAGLDGRGYASARLRLADGPHAGQTLFYAYSGLALAERHGLPTSDDELAQIGGLRFRASITQRTHGDATYNYVSLKGRPL